MGQWHWNKFKNRIDFFLIGLDRSVELNGKVQKQIQFWNLPYDKIDILSIYKR